MNEHKSPSDAGFEDRLEAESQVRELLRSAGRRAALPAEELSRIEQAARQEWRRQVDVVRQPPSQSRGLHPWLALAASLLVAVALGWWWWQRAEPGPFGTESIATIEILAGRILASAPSGSTGALSVELGEGQGLPAGSEIETTAAGGASTPRLALRLNGGESIRLDADTKLRLVSSSRIELQRGALYVDTGPQTTGGGTVEVVTRFATIRHVGTQFEVRLDEAGASVRVRVREGEVALQSEIESYRASVGEELSLREDGSIARAVVSPFGPQWSWVVASAPAIEIEGRSLQSYLDWVARETGWRIRFASEDLERSVASVLLHGTIEGLSPDQSLGVVLLGSGLEYHRDNGALVVTHPEAQAPID